MRRLIAVACLLGLTGFTAMLDVAGAQQAATPAKTAMAHPAFPGATTALGAQIAAILAEPAVARAHWGVAVTTLDGTPVVGLNEGQFFQPASNAKIFTTTAAMELLGGATTVETRVVSRGVWTGAAKLTGDVVLVGGGDANLNGRDLPYISPAEKAARRRAAGPGYVEPKVDPLRYLAAMADQVAASGLRTVTGDIVGDDTLWPWQPYPSDWSIEDATWYYGAPVSALTVNDNQIDVTIAPGAHVGAAPTVTVSPAAPAYYTLDISGLTTGAAKTGSHVGVDLPLGSRTLRLYGTIGVDNVPDVEGIAIHDPAEYAAVAFKQMLEARGITVSGVARAKHAVLTGDNDPTPEGRRFLAEFSTALHQGSTGDGSAYGCGVRAHAAEEPQKVLATRSSATLLQDVQLTNKVSQNLHAELLLHQLGSLVCDQSRAAGVGVVRAFLAGRVGLDPSDFDLFDGSGLSGHDLVTPRAMVKLLQFTAAQPWFLDWRASLPIGGEDGTLASRFPRAPLKDHVWAKTGTLGEARALSGYVQAASGRMLAFSVMVNMHSPASTADRDAMDRMVTAIAAAN